jgi:hypothetical protein
MAKEELKPGKRYFVLMHNIILAFILFFMLEQLKSNIYIILFLPLAFVILSFIYVDLYKKTNYIYVLLGLIFYLSSRSSDYFLIISTLIFFYGFLVGALQIGLKEKNYLKIIGKNAFFFICLILFFI